MNLKEIFFGTRTSTVPPKETKEHVVSAAERLADISTQVDNMLNYRYNGKKVKWNFVEKYPISSLIRGETISIVTDTSTKPFPIVFRNGTLVDIKGAGVRREVKSDNKADTSFFVAKKAEAWVAQKRSSIAALADEAHTKGWSSFSIDNDIDDDGVRELVIKKLISELGFFKAEQRRKSKIIISLKPAACSTEAKQKHKPGSEQKAQTEARPMSVRIALACDWLNEHVTLVAQKAEDAVAEGKNCFAITPDVDRDVLKPIAYELRMSHGYADAKVSNRHITVYLATADNTSNTEVSDEELGNIH